MALRPILKYKLAPTPDQDEALTYHARAQMAGFVGPLPSAARMVWGLNWMRGRVKVKQTEYLSYRVVRRGWAPTKGGLLVVLRWPRGAKVSKRVYVSLASDEPVDIQPPPGYDIGSLWLRRRPEGWVALIPLRNSVGTPGWRKRHPAQRVRKLRERYAQIPHSEANGHKQKPGPFSLRADPDQPS